MVDENDRIRPEWQPSLFSLSEDRLEVRREFVSPASWLPNSVCADTMSDVIPLHCQGHLLDLGCGKMPYYELYRNFVADVTTADWESSTHENNSLVDVTQDLNEPFVFDDESFDTVLLTDVLEHVAETNNALSETFRVLRPGGKVIISVPFLYWLHEVPHDNFRFTCFGLRHVLQKHQFAISDLYVLGDWASVVADFISKRYIHRGAIRRWMIKLLQKNMIARAKSEKIRSRRGDLQNAFPSGYVIVGQK